jgi:D-alanyl-lipoteichoic acid acyltransferase DltB (MBOAT superfamily)
MLFATVDYFLFLPLVAAIHWALQRAGWRTGWLFLASLIFYTAWQPLDTLLLGGVITFAYGAAREVAARPPERRGGVLAASVLVLVAPLLFYKYLHFAASTVALAIPGLPVPPEQRLPIGISFYTFQAIAYVVDVRRGQRLETNFVRFATFLLFFPHLVAGPILRASVLLEQLGADRRLTREDVGHAVWRLLVGLVKKLLIADVLTVGIVDSVFADPQAFTTLEVLLALYAYTLQIYCDFSGYTDFAIGSARLLGFHIPENFDRPYQALTVGDYWRRWHITLSDWVRDYVYYPMGGSRVGGWKVYRNTFMTLLILAVWHGADWTFVLYGFIHGCAVSLHRFLLTRRRRAGLGPVRPGPLGVAWRWLLTFHFVVLARILFRADNLEHAGWVAEALMQPVDWVLPRFSHHALIVLVAGYAVHLAPKRWTLSVRDALLQLPIELWGALVAALGAACVRWGTGATLSFIYYSF